MSEELLAAAYKLQTAAEEYRALFEQERKPEPVVWIRHDETGRWCINSR